MTFFIPTDIMVIITEFLGDRYWKKRSDLTDINIAMDLLSSDYAISSYWRWNTWRRNHPECLISINKPILPERLKERLTTNNPYIESVDPPLGRYHYGFLREEHKILRQDIFGI